MSTSLGGMPGRRSKKSRGIRVNTDKKERNTAKGTVRVTRSITAAAKRNQNPANRGVLERLSVTFMQRFCTEMEKAATAQTCHVASRGDGGNVNGQIRHIANCYSFVDLSEAAT